MNTKTNNLTIIIPAWIVCALGADKTRARAHSLYQEACQNGNTHAQAIAFAMDCLEIEADAIDRRDLIL